jgi:transposase InsO family protein
MLIDELRDRYAHDRGQRHAGMVDFSRPREPTDNAKNESFKERFRGGRAYPNLCV